MIRRNFKRLDVNGDGYLGQNEVNRALSDPSWTGQDAAALAALHKFLDDLQRLSNDEIGFENDGVTLADLQAYEKGTLQKKLGGDLSGVEGTHSHGAVKISKARRELFPNGVFDLAALRQGPIGDCYFLSALGSFIARDPGALVRMIRENKQGQRVVSYTVNFPGGLGSVTVSPPTDGEIARYSSAGSDGLWLVVMEKAYAMARSRQKNPDIQQEIGEGGHLATGLSAFTSAGTDHDFLAMTSRKTTARKLDAAFGRGQGKDAGKRRLVTASIQGENEYGLPKGHAYSVIGWDGTSLTIRNPWGRVRVPGQGQRPLAEDPKSPGVFRMTLDEFDRVFSEVAYEE